MNFVQPDFAYLDRRVSVRVRPLRARLLAASASVCFLVATGSTQLLDTFDDDTLSPLLWSTETFGGPVVLTTNQRIEVVVPADSAGVPGTSFPGDAFWAKVNGACLVRGNFDIQIDFELIDFPYQNGVRIGLWSGNSEGYGLSERVSLGDTVQDSYYIMDTGIVTSIPTFDTSGTLRLVRVGGTITGLYWNAATSAWVVIASGPIGTDDAGYLLFVWSHDSLFGDEEVRVAFDNFRISSGTLVCEHLEHKLASLEKQIDFYVADGGVAADVEQSLHGKVDAALNALARGNPNDAKVAMNDLKALVNFIHAVTGNKITLEAAAAIIESANAIIADLGG
jgi:hypothetical protein